MNISIREFVCSLLLGARSLDENLPHLKMTEHLWESWSFDETGAHYISVNCRCNYPALKPVRNSLIHERAEESYYKTGRWPQ